MRSLSRFPAGFIIVGAWLALASCTPDLPVDQTGPRTPIGTGPRVRWDLGHRPLPEIPLPNDIATRPDPTSPTGLRINASMLAPTNLEHTFRSQFDELDGFGTYEAITVPFENDLDIANIQRRHQGDDNAFANDAVYLIDLETGLPQPLDIGDGNFPYTRRSRDPLFPNDPRTGESNIIFETINEDTNGDGRLQPEEDTNFDGVLGRRNVFPASGNPYDNLTAFFEHSTDTLIVRPLLPLLEQHRYAVVLTDRLVGNDGQPVRSPFETVTHPLMANALSALRGHLCAHSALYGGLRYDDRGCDGSGGTALDGGTGAGGRVAFAWYYTTETTVSELFAARDGLYGRGPFAQLAQITPRMALGRVNIGASGVCRPEQERNNFVIDRQGLQGIFQTLDYIDDPGPARRGARDASYDSVAYAVLGTYHSPYLTAADPRRNIDYHAHWQMNIRTGTIDHVGDAEIPYMLFVPRETASAHAPFPVMIYTHGYGAGITEAFAVAGVMATNGIATIAIDGPTHGLPLWPEVRTAVNLYLRGNCLAGVGDVLLYRGNRARDINGDGYGDPAADFWTSYVVHSRDNVRQYALEISQLIRAMRGFGTDPALGLPPYMTSQPADRQPPAVPIDLNGNGRVDDDHIGDYNGDGRPDVGGPNGRFYVMGESLGGIMSELLGGSEPDIRGSVPYAGGGGLADVGARSVQGGIREAVLLRLMGPMIVGSPPSDYGLRRGDRCTSDNECPRFSTCDMGATDRRCVFTRTSCAANQLSMRLLSTNIDEIGNLEFACANVTNTDGRDGAPTIQPGDTVRVINCRGANCENPIVRCALAGEGGRFQLPFPADTNDPLTLEIYSLPPDPVTGRPMAAVESFGTCVLRPNAHLRSSVSRFYVYEGDCAEGCGHIPRQPARCTVTDTNPDVDNCHTYMIVRRPAPGGQAPALVSPTEGLGLRRQAPEFRRFLTLAQVALEGGDPISFAPYYFLRRPPAQFTQPARHSIINVATVGDQNVPLNTGNAFGRAAGLIPFLRDDAPPHLRDYATPPDLFARYSMTPNHLLIDRHVIEGIYWLNRWPTATSMTYLMDVDNLDEGQQGYGEATLDPPLRLVRLARPVDASNAGDLAAVWAPTMSSTPWIPDPRRPTSSSINYYVRPEGHHSVDEPPRPDLPFDYTTYMYNVAARFFNTDGADIYFRTHPADHRCLERSTCPHLGYWP